MRQAEKILALLAVACALGACPLGFPPAPGTGSTAQELTSVSNFGTNPGGLAMYLYAPAAPLDPAPVVVAMHGCGQTAADYVHAGWNTLADRYGFYVVYPQDDSDLNRCLLWYDPSSNARDQGEALSVKQMVDYMKAHYSIDPARVFATGLSSGGAMTVAMLADYPNVFAAGAAMSGIPYGCATTVMQGQACMAGVTKTAQAWGDLARAAYPGYTGPWPRITLWQGTLDQVVSFTNSAELVKQWTNVHGLDAVVGVTETVGPGEHTVYQDPVSGRTMVESWAVQQMTHGVAVDSADGCGSAIPFVLDVHLCSSLWAARFFGLVPEPADAGAPGLDAALPPSTDAQAIGPGKDASTASADAAALGQDAGAPATDSGHAVSPEEPGCGCGATGGATALILLPLVLLALRRRQA
jgi:poly(hydroxyalkanoate) depolymerase family esterase